MLFGLAHSLRSLTGSPITAAINEARQMARRPLQGGGSVVSPRIWYIVSADSDFVLPADTEPDAVVEAIRAKLREGDRGSIGAPPVLQRTKSGSVAVSGFHIMRLGGGHFDRGKRFLQGIISQIRDRQMRR